MFDRMKWLLRLQGFPVDAAGKMYVHLRQMNGEAFEEWRARQKWALLEFHFEHTPHYRQKLGGKIPDSWLDVPVMKKSDFQKPLEDLISDVMPLRKLYVGNTSGSSGHPFYYAKDKWCHALTWAEIMHLYKLHGIDSRCLQARFYGIPLSGKSRWVEQTKDLLMHRVRFPVFDLSDAVLDRWIARFTQKRFHYLYGYTSSLVYFARYCQHKGISLKGRCPTLRLCIVTSEVCTPEDRRVLEAGFGVPVVNEYGASEVGLIAFEHPDGLWRLCEELLYIEAVDDSGRPVPDGQPGILLITALFNKAMPFIRYEIGDIGVLRTLPDGRKVLESLEGRTNDFVRLPSGKTAPGLTMYYVSRTLLEQDESIREFIIMQTAIDKLQFQIHAKRPLTDSDKQRLSKTLEEYLEPGLQLEIKEVDRIERPGSGKIKHFYSEIKQ